MKFDKQTIQRRALELVATGERGIGARLATEFGVSRQVANGYVQAMLKAGLIRAEGSTRAKTYTLAIQVAIGTFFPREGLREDSVWRKDLAPALVDLPENVRDIWSYCTTEMINNAVDHSAAETVHVRLCRNALFTEIRVRDDGEGIFVKIQRAFGLEDPREAILELAKGKLTTSPENHSGEGIFFTSKVLDRFDILSGSLHFQHQVGTFDTLSEETLDQPGTLVLMRLDNDSNRTLKEVFDAFSDPAEYTFDRTVVPVRLAQFEGERLVSRSQAKRVVRRFERFKQVVIDFAGITAIGQAFADELFRVFTLEHPEVRVIPENVTEEVGQMIRRATNAATAPKPGI